MLHFVTSYMKENKSRKQTLESAQYGLEISFKQTKFKPLPGRLCCVLGQDTLLSQCFVAVPTTLYSVRLATIYHSLNELVTFTLRYKIMKIRVVFVEV